MRKQSLVGRVKGIFFGNSICPIISKISLLLLIMLSYSAKVSSAEILHNVNLSLHYGCSGNACPYYVLVDGIIKEDTPKKFLDFMRKVPYKPTIYFNSPGGNLAAAMELGRTIRKLGLDTFVGGPYESFVHLEQPDKILVRHGICLSACTYAFLGGVIREIAPGGVFGLHQFRSPKGHKGDTGEAHAQVAVTLLAQYLDELGIDRKLLDIASRISSKDLHVLPLHIAQALHVDNTNPPKASWKMSTSDAGNLFAIVEQQQPRKNAVVSLYITRSNQHFIATIFYVIQQKFRSNTYLDEAFESSKSFSILIDNHSLNFNNASWTCMGDGKFRVSFYLDKNIIDTLYYGSELQFHAEFPHAHSDFDPSVTFSLNGFRPALLALLKHRD